MDLGEKRGTGKREGVVRRGRMKRGTGGKTMRRTGSQAKARTGRAQSRETEVKRRHRAN